MRRPQKSGNWLSISGTREGNGWGHLASRKPLDSPASLAFSDDSLHRRRRSPYDCQMGKHHVKRGERSEDVKVERETFVAHNLPKQSTRLGNGIWTLGDEGCGLFKVLKL